MTDQEKLDEAIAALHSLTIGTRAVEVMYGERRVKFTSANMDALRAYIAELKAKIDPCDRRRPMGIIW